MMNKIFSIGIDHNTADLNLRGRFAMTRRFLGEFCADAISTGKLEGVIGLMTCNRNEFYLYGGAECPNVFLELLRGKLDLRKEDMAHIFVLEENESLERLFRVAAGFESVIAGEDQILGQVKTAMEEAIAAKCSCGVLNRMFKDAITCAKEIKSQTGLSENKLSVASIGVSLLEEEYKETGFRKKKALIIGFGDMSKLAASYLSERGIAGILVASRRQESILDFSGETELEWIPYEKRYEALREVDMIISATGAPHIVFEKVAFLKSLQENGFYEKNQKRILSILDMAVPRDIDQEIGQLEGIRLFDMDDFKRISDENMEYRKKLLKEQEFRVEAYIRDFVSWYKDQCFHHLLSRIDDYVESSVTNQAEALLHKLELNGATLESDEVMDYGKKLSERVLKNLALKAKKLPKEKAETYATLLAELL